MTRRTEDEQAASSSEDVLEKDACRFRAISGPLWDEVVFLGDVSPMYGRWRWPLFLYQMSTGALEDTDL